MRPVVLLEIIDALVLSYRIYYDGNVFVQVDLLRSFGATFRGFFSRFSRLLLAVDLA